MNKNITQNTKKILWSYLFLVVSLTIVIRYIYINNDIKGESSPVENPVLIDTKLGQLSDSSKNITVQSTTVVNQNPVEIKKIALTPSKPISVFAGTPGVAGCGLTISLTSEKGFVSYNSNSNYTITIKNDGHQTCENASISVYYSNNDFFISSSPKASASNYYWKLGTMTPSSKKTILITTSYKEGDNLSFNETEACATADNSDDVCATLRVNVNNTNTNNIANVSTPIVSPVIVNTLTNISTNIKSLFGNDNQEYGTWVWNSPYTMSASYRDKIISGAVDNNINVLYLTIDDYLLIDSLPAGAGKEAEKAKYGDALEKFIIAASMKNIAVDVEAGWRNWAEAPNTEKSNAIIDYAISYNASHKNKIRGIQFDIEPYLLSNYEENKNSILKNFITLVDNSVKRIGSNELRLSIVIPHFYDSTQQWTPSVLYNNVNTYTFDHLLRIMDTKPGNSIILMSYRNFAEGEDGSVEISKAEVDGASSGKHSTKIIVGQETGNVEPGYVTFYNTSKSYYKSQTALINKAFKGKSNFGGISVHYIDPFLNL